MEPIFFLLSRSLSAEVNIISFQTFYLFTATGLTLNLGVYIRDIPCGLWLQENLKQ